MTPAEAARQRVNARCLVRRCRKEGCQVSLRDASPDRVVIDFDKPGAPLRRDETRCDYLVVAGNWIAPLELKRGQAGLKIVEQLQAGADVARGLVPGDAALVFGPVVAARGIHRELTRKLRRERIKFGKKAEPVRVIRCGGALAEAFQA